jgi:hypothetical protein
MSPRTPYGKAAFAYRCSLWTKLWLKSPFGWLVVVCAFAAARLIVQSGQHSQDIASSVYEKEGMLLAAVTVSWAMSLDADSGWLRQIWTYPQRRIVVIAERYGFGMLLFCAVMAIISVYMHARFGSNVWKVFMFALPVHATVGACAMVGTILANHSLGGLLGAVGLWAAAVGAGDNLGEYAPTVVHFTGVFRAVVHAGTSTAVPWDGWVVANRFWYMAAFGTLWAAAVMLVLRRK